MKLFISPQFNKPDAGDGGIRRVIEAMIKYLPEYDIEIVDKLRDADIVNAHAGDVVDTDKPIVASSHGLYWSDYQWPHSHYIANQRVIENMVRSKHVTAPSRWVARALARGISRPITPIHHGVEIDEWQPGDNGGYVLWNKARADAVSDPRDLIAISEKMPKVPFVTTIGLGTDNVHVIGPTNYQGMKPYVQNAAVYLATARETFGIGTLEAMASGVPVVGWDHGGQSEIIINDWTGYLVPYGDYEALSRAVIAAYENRHVLSENCLDDVRARWGWPDKIAQYAGIFHNLVKPQSAPKLSIIVTCYNLAKYLPACLDSVLRLPFDNWQCIIVDDASTDDTRDVAKLYCVRDRRFMYRCPEENLGLSGARNYGFEFSTGDYILPLDADDVLHPPGAVELIDALDDDPTIHIAYGNLHMMSEDGSDFHSEVSEANEFNWLAQMAHINQPFYCAMMRREVLRDTGGYRVHDWRAEDASFWARATSFGFRAEKVTKTPTIFYRLRGDSKGAAERQKYPDGDGDWLAWYGWRLASTYADGQKVMGKKRVPDPVLVPFGAQAKPPSDVRTWQVGHHQTPLISVIIPVGPGHAQYLTDCLDSLLAQTFYDWEAIVINDTGHKLDLHAHQWARVVETEGGQGAGAARNVGLEIARGDLVLFLDGDDWLLRNAMRDMVTKFVELNGQYYIYSNYISTGKTGKTKHEKLHPYNQGEWRGQHAVTVLMTRTDAEHIGGFDESMIGWEDWDFAIKCAINGICGHHIPSETFVYRAYSGARRDTAASVGFEKLLPILRERYEGFYTGEKQMAGCGCTGNGADVLMKAKKSLGTLTTQITVTADRSNNGMTRMKFVGTRPGSKNYLRVGGKLLTRQYRGGNNAIGRYIDADPTDVPLLISTGEWAIEEGVSEVEASDTLPPPVALTYDIPSPEPLTPPRPDYDEYNHQQGRVAADERYPPSLKVWAHEQTADVMFNASPKAVEEAQQAGLDLSQITGTGKDGRITVKDVRNAAKELA